MEHNELALLLNYITLYYIVVFIPLVESVWGAVLDVADTSHILLTIHHRRHQ